MAISSTDSLTSLIKDTKSPTVQLTPAAGNRISSSSLVSLGEDLAERELQTVNWNVSSSSSSAATKCATPIANGPSPVTLTSKSPSPSILSREFHPVHSGSGSEREIHYAQLDLTVCQRSSEDKADEVPKSPRIPRPGSTSGLFDTLSTAYAQIDFKKNEGFKAVAHP